MECAEIRSMLDNGIRPGSADARRAALGFHLAACAQCRAYRAHSEALLLGTLLAAPLASARPHPCAAIPLQAPRLRPHAPLGAIVLLAGALAVVPIGHSLAPRASAKAPVAQALAHQPQVARVGRVIPRDEARLTNGEWLAARLAAPLPTGAGPALRPRLIQPAARDKLLAERPAVAPQPATSPSWEALAASEGVDLALSQLAFFEAAGPQQVEWQSFAPEAAPASELDAALADLPLEAGSTLLLPDPPQPPVLPPTVMTVPGQPEPAAPANPASPARPAPAAARSYVVQPGDTLTSIALKLYGNASRWPEIYRANRAVIGGNPDRIFPQQRYSIPGQTSGSAGGSQSRPVRAVTPAPSGQPYTVLKGDSMRGIALGYYGNEMRWKEIYNANKALIPDPDNLRIGIKLQIPGQTSGSAGGSPSRPVRAVTPAPSGQPYIVLKGDSMRGIALGYYGNEMRWKEIYNANKALIPDPDNLRIGIKLRIP